MSWTFQGIAYQTKRDYYAAIAQEWLSAGGANSRRYIRETFFHATDEELADEVIEGWSLDGQQPPFERDGLTQAFADYRKTVEDSPVEGDEDSNRTLW
jgi:hypothetical protein